MKSLLGGLLLFAAIPVSVVAQPFQDNCEVLYWEMNKEAPKITLEQYLGAGCGDSSSSLIRKAERYKTAALRREQEIEQKLKERIAAAEGKRAGKVVRTFDSSDFGSIAENPLNAPIVSRIVIFKSNGKTKTYETSPNHLCEKLGYEKSLNKVYSRELSDGKYADKEFLPERLIEFRERSTFRNPRIVIHSFNDPDRDYGMEFQTFESITCEKTRLANEPIEDFEVDVEAIRRALEEEVKAPGITDDVERILSLNRSTPARIENELGEDRTKSSDDSDDDGYSPSSWSSDDNEFVYKSNSK